MVCIYCTRKTQVTNSRPQKRLGQVWRRHRCMACEAVFTTIETPDLTSAVLVASRGAPKAFSRDKLLVSLLASLGHRGDAVEAAGALTATITAKLLRTSGSAEIKATDITRIATEVLSRFDKTAAVHYAAYHPTKP